MEKMRSAAWLDMALAVFRWSRRSGEQNLEIAVDSLSWISRSINAGSEGIDGVAPGAATTAR